jgi:putative ABC transport system ATP-binding protein
LVLADKPTAALDKQSSRKRRRPMEQLAREHGTSIPLVTHDNRILDIANRVVAMEDQTAGWYNGLHAMQCNAV